jgi:hypothetical protein
MSRSSGRENFLRVSSTTRWNRVVAWRQITESRMERAPTCLRGRGVDVPLGSSSPARDVLLRFMADNDQTLNDEDGDAPMD